MPSSPTVTANDNPQISDLEVRFAFGKNWRRFLVYLDGERIEDAERSLCDMLGLKDFNGKSFLDVGCGSGLFSLAAARLGAAKVHSFDCDAQSVACAEELRRSYSPGGNVWTIEQGDVLDSAYVRKLGQFDIVYSWGVLHHTGNLRMGFENVAPLVTPGGTLFLAVYNDQGFYSQLWRIIKRNYSRWPILRPLLIAMVGPYFLARSFIAILRRNPLKPRATKRPRGMAFWPDLQDWLGGYPFEVAKPEVVFDFFRAKGFELRRLRTVARALCNNEYVFQAPRAQND